jgi:predicted HAD superfamily Cof-like phosphohydrolase
MNLDSILQPLVADFNKKVNSPPNAELRVKLIQEEAQELLDAASSRNGIELIDALCDLLYVTYGAAHTFGITLKTMEAEHTIPEDGDSIEFFRIIPELKDFNAAVGEAVLAIKTKDPSAMVRPLTELVEGCWKMAAEAVHVDLKPFFYEVHRTNMAKLNGPKRGDGKQMKPEGWAPPRIKNILTRVRDRKPVRCEELDGCTSLMVKDHIEGGQYCCNCKGLLISESDVVAKAHKFERETPEEKIMALLKRIKDLEAIVAGLRAWQRRAAPVVSMHTPIGGRRF